MLFVVNPRAHRNRRKRTVVNPRMPVYAPGRSTRGMIGYMVKYSIARSVATFLIRAVLWIIGMALLFLIVPAVFVLVR